MAFNENVYLCNEMNIPIRMAADKSARINVSNQMDKIVKSDKLIMKCASKVK